MLLDLPCQLDNLLRLLVLDLKVLLQLVLDIVDLTSYKSTLFLRALNIERGPLYFRVLLVEHTDSFGDVASDLGLLLGQACVLILHSLELGLEHLLFSHLLFELVLVVRAQIVDALLQVAPSDVNLVDLCPECLIHGIEVCTIL